MALSARDRVLYARHLLLHEIGSAGQERLCQTHVQFPHAGDEAVAAVAADYLARAGLVVGDLARDAAHTEMAEVADSTAVHVLAGEPELVHAAQALLGALSATDVIKRAAGLGTPAAPHALCRLGLEDA